MKGWQFQTGDYLKPQPDPAEKMFAQDRLQPTWRYASEYPSLSITSQTSPAVANTLTYRIKPDSTFGVTIRRRTIGGAWQVLRSGYSAETYQDSDASLVPGTRYEYAVSRDNGVYDPVYVARAVACVNQPIDVFENRGKLLLIIDQSVFGGISQGLGIFTNDLIGDGWSVVLKSDAGRHDDRYIQPGDCPPDSCGGNAYRTDPAADLVNQAKLQANIDFIRANPDAKGVVLIGHVTIPYSGYDGADGHCNHFGAWPSDAYYGHSGNGWSDANDLQSCAWNPGNSNRPLDSKFDNDSVPNPTEYTRFVGRIDFARLPAFGTGDAETPSEESLLSGYFAKGHAYRNGTTRFDRKGIVHSAFHLDIYTGHPDGNAYSHAFAAMSTLLGLGLGSDYGNIITGDPFHQRSNSYLWGFLGGFGGPDLISQNVPGFYPLEGPFLQHTSGDLASGGNGHVAFYLLLGSYFGDWNFQNDFMRSAIATPTYGLVSAWMDRKYSQWQLHRLALGDTIGSCLVETISDMLQVYPAYRWYSILGDPTLRMDMPLPPAGVVCNGSALTWSAGNPDGQDKYAIYKATTKAGPYTRIASEVSGTTYPITDCSAFYMVRAEHSVTTGTATYTNLSQGAFSQ